MKTTVMVGILVLLATGSALAGILGDVNNDGQVGIAEAVYALQISSGLNSTIPDNCVITGGDAWASGLGYTACDVVNHDGAYYICIQAHVSATPPDTDGANWAIMALGNVGLVGPVGSRCSQPGDDSQLLRDELARSNHVTLPAGTEWRVGQVDLSHGQSISGPGTICKLSTAPYALQITGFHASVSGVYFKPQNVSGQPNCDIKLGNGAHDARITDNNFWGTTYSAVCGADDSAVPGGGEYTTHATGILVANNTFFGYVRPLFLHSVDNLTIQGNIIHDTTRDAIRLRENDGYVIINGNQFQNIGNDLTYSETQDAVDTAWSGSKLIISDNIVRKTAMMGFDIKEVSDDGSVGSRSVIIANNHISETYGSGIVMYGDGDQAYTNYTLLVEGNIFEHNNRSEVIDEAAIRVRGAARYITIANNHVMFNRGRGIRVQNEYGGVSGVKILGNTVVNNGIPVTSGAVPIGIIAAGVDNLIITNNEVANDPTLENSGVQKYGMVITDSTNTIIRNNIVRCNTVGQIYVDGVENTSTDNIRIDCP